MQVRHMHQQTSRPGEILITNLNSSSFPVGKNHGSLVKVLLGTNTKQYTKCHNLILKTPTETRC